MAWVQRTVQLRGRARGFHLVTNEIESAVPELAQFTVGVAHIFIQHTSASLTVNENADPTVRADFETHFTRMVPEEAALYQHNYEGLDDMTSHIKASILGPSVTVPITDGRFNFGTWQGIYLCEHRENRRPRTVVITLTGERKNSR